MVEGDVLTLMGLILSFIGSIILVIDTLIRFGKPKSIIFTPTKYGKDGKPTKIVREKQIFDSRGMPAGYREIKITGKEITLLVSLFLISEGFFLQIVSYFIK